MLARCERIPPGRDRNARQAGSPMQLAVLHYHFRPGGVRRVIELGLPALVAAGGVSHVMLAGGEEPEPGWEEQMEAALHPCAVTWLIEPALGYWSERTQSAAAVRGAIRDALERICPRGGVLWAHNLSVGRNMILTQEVAAMKGAEVWLLHHDWWWDGRWERWPEMSGQGIESLEAALVATLPDSPGLRHFCVNAADARRLREWTGREFHFLPNAVIPEPVTVDETEAAREFLRRTTGRGASWVYPCRGLRRKNIAEALLAQRLLAPEAATVTTGGVSSAAERGYFSALTAAAERHGWSLHAGVCTGGGCPPVSHLLSAADAVTVTSLREGFGLPYYEAAGRPLAARIPAGMEETLRATGFDFQNGWREMLVPRGAFDAGAEAARMEAGRRRLQELLPRALQGLAEQWSRAGRDAPDFGTLSLTAQLEVLRQPQAAVRDACFALNPGLRIPLSPQPPASKTWTAQAWAAALLSGARKPASAGHRDSLPAGALPFLAPLLYHWLRHPLLWESAPAQP